MSRNGSGVYSLPGGSTVTNGDTSDASDLNVPLADIEADLNVARPVVAGGTGATSAAAALVNLGLTATAAEINVLDGITSTVAELNVLDGIPGTLTATELGYVDGVTSAIQTQLNAKQASGATLTSLEGLALVQGDTLYATAADTLARLPKGTAGQVLAMNSGATAPEWISNGVPITWEALVSTSGAGPISVSTTLPATATEIYFLLNGPSLSGSDNIIIQLGTAGSWITSGYDAIGTVSGGASGGATATNGALVFGGVGSRAYKGLLTFYKFTAANAWVWTVGGHDGVNAALGGGGTVTTTDQPTRIRIDASGGNTFDAGNVRVGYR